MPVPVRLILLTCLVLVAFAANSVLNRLGVSRFATDPLIFAVVRTAAGAAMLALLVLVRRARPDAPGRSAPAGTALRRLGAGVALAVYMAGFSLAYLTLDAGVGALILFGGVQITMFAGAFLSGEAVTRRRAIGAAIAFGGLMVLAWPGGEAALVPAGVGLMLAAAAGWGVYSLMGRRETDPLAATAANFAICLPLVLPLLWWADGGWTGAGIVVATIAGAVTSGLGYALWYAVVPAIGASRAAVAQLSVPVIAAAGGVAFLGEPLTALFALCTLIVLGGIAVSLGGGAAAVRGARPGR